MSCLRIYRTIHVAALLLGLLLLGPLLAGCDGGSSVASSVYAGKTVAATNITLNALTADLQVKTASSGIAASGTLTLTDPTRAVIAHSRLIIATPNCTGTYDPKTGALSLNGSYEYPAGTTHNFTITGTLPVLPSNKGSLTITVDGTAYGPFVFGNNANTGGTGTTGQGGLTVSGAAGTAELKNGLLSRPFTASKITTPFTINGIAYNGQYSVGTDSSRPYLALDLFDLNLVVGETFDLASPERCNMNAIDNSGAYDADSGTITVTAVSATSLTLSFVNVHFKAAPGSTPQANQFTLNGSISAPVTVATAVAGSPALTVNKPASRKGCRLGAFTADCCRTLVVLRLRRAYYQ